MGSWITLNEIQVIYKCGVIIMFIVRLTYKAKFCNTIPTATYKDNPALTHENAECCVLF